MKNGKLELFDDVMIKRGKGQIRHIDLNTTGYPYFIVGDCWYEWFHESDLTFIPKTPVMVYVSDESEEDAIECRVARELLVDFGDKYPDNYRYIVAECDKSGWVGYNYAVPVDSLKAKPKTVSKQQIKEAQELLEAWKNGAIVEGNDE